MCRLIQSPFFLLFSSTVCKKKVLDTGKLYCWDALPAPEQLTTPGEHRAAGAIYYIGRAIIKIVLIQYPEKGAISKGSLNLGGCWQMKITLVNCRRRWECSVYKNGCWNAS